MTNEEIYEKYNFFVEGQMASGNYDTIPHCDSRILHCPSDCEYCRDAHELQKKRAELGIAWTGKSALQFQIPCEADVARPPGEAGDHRRWYGNRPTSVERGDPSWPEETFASKAMYAEVDPFRAWPSGVRAELVAEIERKADQAQDQGSIEEAGGMHWVANYIETGRWDW